MSFPTLNLNSLDQMWFQISGTLCNLSCEHCFISCNPHNNSFELMNKESVFKIIRESAELGVKEFYFTGGEPFIHQDIIRILEYALSYAPTTVLTNGILIKENKAQELKRIHQNSDYSLEIRVSLDSYLEEEHDKIRGINSFKKALNGIKILVENDFLPIITLTRTWDEADEINAQNKIKEILNNVGYNRSRIKILPVLKIGNEARRGNSYNEFEKITYEMMIDFDSNQLLCSNSRIATSKGFYSCPILIDAENSKLGNEMSDIFKPVKLSGNACYTCYTWGSICQNIQAGEKYAR